jgi:hypothetical protein
MGRRKEIDFIIARRQTIEYVPAVLVRPRSECAPVGAQLHRDIWRGSLRRVPRVGSLDLFLIV